MEQYYNGWIVITTDVAILQRVEQYHNGWVVIYNGLRRDSNGGSRDYNRLREIDGPSVT